MSQPIPVTRVGDRLYPESDLCPDSWHPVSQCTPNPYFLKIPAGLEHMWEHDGQWSHARYRVRSQPARADAIAAVWRVVDELAAEVAADRVAFRSDVRSSPADVRRRLYLRLTEALGERPI